MYDPPFYINSCATQMEPASRFSYSILEPGYLRLLSIDGIDHNGAVTCSQVNAKFDATTVYDALSYAWSKDEVETSITYNSLPLIVTTDLYEALRCLLILGHHNPIWIDAIRIDQSSPTDEAAQVPLMGQYYSRAKKIQIWLGPSTKFSEVAIDMIPRLSSTMQSTRQQSQITDQWLQENHLRARYDPVWEATEKNESIDFELALQLGRFRETTKEVDRVYAILGMIDINLRQQIRVEYGKKPEAEFWKLYLEVGKLSLQRNSSQLTWLSLCQSKKRPEELPSWCPNLHSKNDASLFLDCYFAGFTPNREGNPRISFTADNHLIIRGVATAVIQTVAQYSEKWDTEHEPSDGPREHATYLLRWMKECLELSQKAYAKPEHVMLKSLTRTLIADTLGGQAGLTQEFFMIYGLSHRST